MRTVASKIVLVLIAVAVIVELLRFLPSTPPAWSDSEIAVLQTLTLAALPNLPPDSSNAVADNPLAAEFGEKLFADTRLSANGAVSCATCHQEERAFTDGLQKAVALGTTDRHTPSIVGAAYSPWQFWDGRSDSQWAQALAPLEDTNEHGTTREQVVSLVLADAEYRAMYDTLFADAELETNVVFANVGKSIAAFERTIVPGESRFDKYVSALVSGDASGGAHFDEDEIWGLRLFIGEANCLQCHNGPLLTNHEFHNNGVISFPGEIPDTGRSAGVREVLASEFSCRSEYNDDPNRNCPELDFARTGVELIGTFKTPSLRDVELTAPYMHKGQLANLASVLRHYNDAPDAMVGHNEAKPLGFSSRELKQLEAFLRALTTVGD